MRIVLSLLLMAVGAVMWFSVTSSSAVLGANAATAGLILMVAGILELAACAVLWNPPMTATSPTRPEVPEASAPRANRSN